MPSDERINEIISFRSSYQVRASMDFPARREEKLANSTTRSLIPVTKREYMSDMIEVHKVISECNYKIHPVVRE